MSIWKEMDAQTIYMKKRLPFHFAATLPYCNINLIKQLLDIGATVNNRNELGQTPLHYFLQDNHPIEIIKLLLDYGAFIDAMDVFHRTPLHYSLIHSSSRIEVVRLLLERRANVSLQNDSEEQPIHFAAKVGNPEILKLLFEYDVDVNALDEHHQSPLHHALLTPNCKISVVKLLLENGAVLFQRNKDGDQPLHIAVLKCKLEIINLLLSYGANVNYYNDEGQTPLKHALHANRSVDVVKTLLKRGANILSPDEVGDFILHMAVKCKPDIVRLLLDYGALINMQGLSNRTPLIHALTSSCNPGVIKLLVERGADVNLGDDCRQTPLHLAVFHWDVAIVKLLLDHGAKINVINFLDNTPLFNAVFFHYDDNSLAIIKLLLDYGARVHLGSSPLKITIDIINGDDIASNTVQYSKILKRTKLLIKYSLLERPTYDIRSLCVNPQICEDLMNYRKECLFELHTFCIGDIKLAEFIIMLQREKESRNLDQILHVLSNNPCPLYKEVISGLLKKRELQEKLNGQIEPVTVYPYTTNLNVDCLYILMKYFNDHEDLLNLALAFNV